MKRKEELDRAGKVESKGDEETTTQGVNCGF